jgi:5-methylcytosine-specific restriction endonuclease McrA
MSFEAPRVLTAEELEFYGVKWSPRRRRTGLSWEEKRAYVFRRDGYKCVYCGSQEAPFHCDHHIPQCLGGSNQVENLVTACKTCNLKKHGKSPEKWLRLING